MFGPSQQWILVGVTSNGVGCARPEYSGIYVRVATFEDWIKLYTNSSVWVESGTDSDNDTTSTMTTSMSTGSWQSTRTMPWIGSQANIPTESMLCLVVLGSLSFFLSNELLN